MGPQGTIKWASTEHFWQVETHYQVANEFYEVPSGQHFFPLGSRMGSQETPTGAKTEIA